MKGSRICSILVILVCLAGLTAQAAIVDTVRLQNGRITVEGSLETDQRRQIAAVYLLRPGKTSADLRTMTDPNAVLFNLNMTALDENGAYSCTLPGGAKYQGASLFVKSGDAEAELPLAEYQGGGTEIFVSPQGNDNGLGTRENPLRTLDGARRRVRALKADGKAITVYFLPGEYRMMETVRFTAEDSGTAQCPVTYRAYTPGTVTFKGSVRLDISELEPVTDQAVLGRLPAGTQGYVRQLNLGNYGIKPDQVLFRNLDGQPVEEKPSAAAVLGLYLNGQRQDIARWPNVGYESFRLADGSSGLLDKGYEWTYSQTEPTPAEPVRGACFRFEDANPQRWTTAEDMYIDGYLETQYSGTWRRVESVDPIQKTIRLEKGVINSPDRRWTAVNLLEELDIPGEFYIDRDTLTLYYYPAYPLDPEKDVLEYAAMYDPLVDLTGVGHICFEGLTFTQVYGEAVMGNLDHHIRLDGCEISNTGGSGIYLASVTDTEIRNCTVYNTAGNGINLHTYENLASRLGLIPCGNVAENNHIYNVGQDMRNMSSGVNASGVGVRIANNLIHLSANMGAGNGGPESVVTHNEMYNLIRDTADAGGIYIGRQWDCYGTQYTFNYLHDFGIEGFRENEHTSGIFWDDFLSGQTAEHNIIVNDYPGTAYGININGGRDLRVRNNIFVGGDYAIRNTDRSNNPDFLNEENSRKMLSDLAAVVTGTNAYSAKYPGMLENYREMTDPGDPDYTGTFNPKNMDFTGNIMANIQYADEQNQGVYVNGRIGSDFKDTVQIQSYLAPDMSVFVDPAAQDYRITPAGKQALGLDDETFLLDTDFDLDTIGLQSELTLGADFRKISPAAGSTTGRTGPVTLAWEQALFADSYTYVVSENPDLSNPTVSGTTMHRRAEISGLKPNTVYYWQVTANHTSRRFAQSWTGTDGIAEFRTPSAGLAILDFKIQNDKASVLVTNTADQAVSGRIILAGYRADGGLQDAHITEAVEFPPQKTLQCGAFAADGEAAYYTALIWDGTAEMRPLTREKAYGRRQ